MSTPPPFPAKPAHCPILGVAVIDFPQPDKVAAAERWQRQHRRLHRKNWRTVS